WVKQHGREPGINPAGDIFERIYATRLQALRRDTAAHELLRPMDARGLLAGTDDMADPTALSPAEVLAALSEGSEAASNDITQLRHVRPVDSRTAPDEIAQRKPAADFHLYKRMFQSVAQEVVAK